MNQQIIHPMKKLCHALVLLIISACSSERLDMQSSIATAESAVKHIGNKEFEELFKLYSKNFSESEPQETREKKLSKIVDAVGKLQEMTLIDSSRIENTGEESSIVITYKVRHSNTTTTESFTVVKEEGKYLLSDVHITNQ